MPALSSSDITNIQSAISLAILGGITYDQLEKLLLVAQALAIANNGRYLVNVGDGSTNLGMMSADGIMTALELVRKFKAQDAGPVIMTPEFSPDGASGVGSGWGLS